jgi:hypothetical protein
MNLNIRELKVKKRCLKQRTFEHFQSILEDCGNEIKKHAELNREFCNFIVPRCKITDPVYNVSDLEHYIITQLTNKGLFIVVEQPRLLYISWKDKDLEYVKQQRMMEERREQLQSEMDLFNDTYEPQAQRAMMLDEILSKEHQRQTRHIPSRKLEKIKPSDIHNSTTRTITHSRSHRPRQHKQTTQSTSTAKKTTKSKVDDTPPVVNMNVMYDDGIQDIIPVDESIRDLIIDFQDGFNY